MNSYLVSGSRHTGVPPGLVASILVWGGMLGVMIGSLIYGAALGIMQGLAFSWSLSRKWSLPVVFYLFWSAGWYVHYGDPSVFIEQMVHLPMVLVLVGVLRKFWPGSVTRSHRAG